ncbi:MAG TPA: NAD(P)-dependent oxidoreductase [bacterium]|nr:NAD(P)-dependent oxidoreductase [bacterium]
MKPRVFVSQPIPEPGLEILREVADVRVFPRVDRNMSQEEWIVEAARSDYLLVMGGNNITAEILKANPKLKGVALVHRRLPQGNSVDLDTARQLGIPVIFQYPWEPVYDHIADATADLTIAMLLGLAYRMVDADRYTRSGRSLQEHTMALMGPGVIGKTVGLFGLGIVAKKMVPRLRPFRCSLLYNKRTRLSPDQEREMGLTWVASKDELLRRSDFFCLEVDYNPDNHMIIGEREFGLMKPTAYFINTARGRLVDEPALVRALQNKTIAGAGLDVFWHEPPRSPEMAPSPEFFTMDSVILAPHNGGATWHARSELTKATARQIVALIQGERPDGLVLD